MLCSRLGRFLRLGPTPEQQVGPPPCLRVRGLKTLETLIFATYLPWCGQRHSAAGIAEGGTWCHTFSGRTKSTCFCHRVDWGWDREENGIWVRVLLRGQVKPQPPGHPGTHSPTADALWMCNWGPSFVLRGLAVHCFQSNVPVEIAN